MAGGAKTSNIAACRANTVHIVLSDGKSAVVEKSHESTLIPWQPVIDRQLGREVIGVVQGGSVSVRVAEGARHLGVTNTTRRPLHRQSR